ncbi:MAG: hypothetical protein QOD32_767, partial [Pyrinomonadaceae bacterium]|nr:hypothetical protein [Pyrinomonadaceae bacterium]
YLIGRKGTGKTAICEYLYKQTGPKRFSRKLTFKSFPFNNLYQLENNRFKTPNQYITLWKYLIYSSVAKMMIENQNIDSDVRMNLEKVYGNDPVVSLQRTISKWTGKNFEFTILGTGGAAGRTQNEVSNDMPWIERVEILENLIQQNLDDSSYMIVFDELDEDYKDVSEPEKYSQYNALITSLFKAIQDIRSIFALPSYKVFPILFLRDDIYDLVKDPDKSKWSDLIIELDWNTDKIKQLLTFRISRALDASGNILYFDEAWDKIFLHQHVEYGFQQKKRMSPFDFITRSTLIRPRDYVRYIRACAMSASANNLPRVSPEIIRKVDKAFSNELKGEMVDEAEGFLPEMREVFDIISHMRKQKFSFSEFSIAYQTSVERGLLPKRDAEFILKVLFHFSIVGNQPRQKMVQIFRYQNKEARLNLNESLCVHRGLYKALQII